MQAVVLIWVTSARANATSSTFATQHGPTFHAAPEGPMRPDGNAITTPSGSTTSG